MNGFVITMVGLCIVSMSLVIWSNTKSGEKWFRDL